jgi:hypothetical protein
MEPETKGKKGGEMRVLTRVQFSPWVGGEEDRSGVVDVGV